MALVAYDYGSDSEEDEDADHQPKPIIENGGIKDSILNGKSRCEDENIKEPCENSTEKNEPVLPGEISDDEDEVPLPSHTISNMFEKLPQKKEIPNDNIKPDFEDIVEDFIPKAAPQTKEKAKVRILVPSLSEFDDIDEKEPVTKKFKQSVKGTGLLSLLPPVKCVPLTNKSFVPNVLTQKNKANEQVKKISKPLVPDSVRKKKEASISSKKEDLDTKSKQNESDDSDVEMPETYDDELWQKVCGKKVVKKIIVEEEPVIKEPIINLAPEPVAPYQGLDNAAFKELVGKSSRMPRNIKLIDINEDQLVAEKDLWMTKSLTDPEYIPKPSEDDDSIDPTKRKKHHITYLAQKAKANEQELQTQWAASKHNRMQSRAKYGF